MRNLILKMSMSLDGFVGGPDAELEWLFRNVLGRGLPIFSRLAKPQDLQLVEAKTFPGGSAAHIYRPRA